MKGQRYPERGRGVAMKANVKKTGKKQDGRDERNSSE